MRGKVKTAKTVREVVVPFDERLTCCQCGVEVIAAEREEYRCFWCVEPMCSGCWNSHNAQCVACARSVAAAEMVARMGKGPIKKRLGRPLVVRPCKVCGERYGAREMRVHMGGHGRYL